MRDGDRVSSGKDPLKKTLGMKKEGRERRSER